MNTKVVKILCVLILYIIVDFIVGSWYLAKTHKQRFTYMQEAALQNSNKIYNNYFNFGFAPNTSINYRWGSEKYPLYVNSLGFLDKEIRDVPLASAKYRILFLGDSFVEGVGYPFKETFIGRLETMSDMNTVEFLNAGVQGYSPIIYYTKLKYLLDYVKLSIDEVVVFIDISDIQNEVMVYKQYVPEFDQPYTTSPFNQKLSLPVLIKGFIFDHSLLINTVTNYVDSIRANTDTNGKDFSDVTAPMWTYDDKFFNSWGKEGLDLCAKHMTQLIRLSRNHNIKKVSIVVYPWPEQIKHQDRNSLQVSFWKNFSNEAGVDFINLFPDFFSSSENGDLFIPGDVHWNDNGHKLTATILYSALGISSRSSVFRDDI